MKQESPRLERGMLPYTAMGSISLWPQRNQNESKFYLLNPKFRKCDLAVYDIHDDITENMDTN